MHVRHSLAEFDNNSDSKLELGGVIYMFADQFADEADIMTY